jgi:probable HAF family extracellular repeat protein
VSHTYFAKLIALPAGLACLFTPHAAMAQTPSFQTLGQMPHAGAGTYASGISGDGTTIMGYGWICNIGTKKDCSYSDTVRAYRWTVVAGYQLLDGNGNTSYFGAGGVSFDGSVIVGEHALANGFDAFRWTAGTGVKRLPFNIATAVTPDGTTVAGGDRWWNSSGQTGIFDPFPGEQDQTQAYGLSGTGQAPIAVGGAIKGSGPNGATYHSFRWTPSGGLTDLGVLVGDQSFATAISADGTVIVGEHSDASGFWRAYRWTAATGMVDLGTLGGPEAAPTAVNGNGSVIVGTSLTSGESASNEPFIWTAKTAMQGLNAVLDAYGVHTGDKWVSLDTLTAVSADGTTMVGYGESPRTKTFPFGKTTPFRVVLTVP